MKSNSISLEALVAGRDGVPLTAPIHCRVEAGEVLAIHGPNGCGKSTLLKTIAGLMPPYSGRVGYGQETPSVAYLGHRHGMLAGTSVYDNIRFFAHGSGAPELIPAALHYFDLEDYADTDIASLSAGWQQRVALTRLILAPAALWILDEPGTNLDAEGVALLQSLFTTRLERGGIIVLASPFPTQGPAVRTLALEPAPQEG